MEKDCDVQELEPQSVSEVIGEPATVINGVPEITPGSVTTNLDTPSSSESDDDPCFGEWLEGRKFQKLFGGKYYYGKVEKYDKETKWYRVVYEDGDFEDMEWHELEEVLLPLDISIPLTTIALARCKSEKSVSWSKIKLAKGRYTNGSGSKKKTLKLPQISHVGESQDELGANFSRRTHQGTLQLQNGLQREYTTASNVCNGQESDSIPVFDVVGEPAIVINGLKDVTLGCTATVMDNMDSIEQGDCPFFGQWIIGRKVQKLFGDRYYLGKVEKYDEETKWYRVVYEDGDFEDLKWHELEKLLVPLDISIPLTTMALYVDKPLIKCSGRMEKAMANVRKRNHQENFKMQKKLEIESVGTRSQMCKHGGSFSEEVSAVSKHKENGENRGKMLNTFQTPARAGVNGGLVLTDARSLKQSWKTARAEKQRRREKSFVHSSAYHPQ